MGEVPLYRPVIKGNFPPRNYRQGLMCCKFCHVTPYRCGSRRRRSSPSGGERTFEKNHFTEMCSGSEAGSYERLMDFVYHSSLGLRVIQKKQKARRLAGTLTDSGLRVVVFSWLLERNLVYAEAHNMCYRVVYEEAHNMWCQNSDGGLEAFGTDLDRAIATEGFRDLRSGARDSYLLTPYWSESTTSTR